MENRLVMFVGAQGEETLSFGISTKESEDSYRVTAAQAILPNEFEKDPNG